MRCYDFPPRIPGHLFASLPGSTRSSSVRVSQLALPVGRRGLSGRGHCSTGDPIAGVLPRGRERDLPGFQAIHPVPLPRSTTPAEPTTPRLPTVSSMLPPRFPRRRLQRLMNFGALSRGFGTCCLRFKNSVATIPAKLASGWLARLYREGVEPSGSLQKVSDHPSSSSGLTLQCSCIAQFAATVRREVRPAGASHSYGRPLAGPEGAHEAAPTADMLDHHAELLRPAWPTDTGLGTTASTSSTARGRDLASAVAAARA